MTENPVLWRPRLRRVWSAKHGAFFWGCEPPPRGWCGPAASATALYWAAVRHCHHLNLKWAREGLASAEL